MCALVCAIQQHLFMTAAALTHSNHTSTRKQIHTLKHKRERERDNASLVQGMPWWKGKSNRAIKGERRERVRSLRTKGLKSRVRGLVGSGEEQEAGRRKRKGGRGNSGKRYHSSPSCNVLQACSRISCPPQSRPARPLPPAQPAMHAGQPRCRARAAGRG